MSLPSPWIQRWSSLVAPGARVLDLACGTGRHVLWFAGRAAQVTAVDRDVASLAGLRAIARTIEADIENGPWPLPGECFDAVVVTNYLWRPLVPRILDAVGPGGVLLYETFCPWSGQCRGGPRALSSCSSRASCCTGRLRSRCASSLSRTAFSTAPRATFSAWSPHGKPPPASTQVQAPRYLLSPSD